MGFFDFIGDVVSGIPGIGGIAKGAINLLGGGDKKKSGLQSILDALGGGGIIPDLLSTFAGGAASGAEKKKDRDLLSPEGMEKEGYIPTYKGLKQSAPLLNKLIGGMIGKYFGGEGIGVGLNELMPGGQASAQAGETAPLQGDSPTTKALKKRVPSYFRKKYDVGGAKRMMR